MQQPRENKHSQLIDHASSSLNAFGVSHTSLSEVASRLGVSREALYYYVKDKEDLVFQCYLHSCKALSTSLDMAQVEQDNALDILDAFVSHALDKRQPEFAAISEIYCLNEKQRRLIIDNCLELKKRLAKIIKSGIDNKEIRPCSPGIIALATLGMVSWIPTAKRWRPNARLSREDIANATQELLKLGISVNRESTMDYQQSDLAVDGMPISQIFDSKALTAARKSAILAAASWLFNLKGFGATSLDEIADKIGVTKKVIYHNIGNKEKLLIACFKRTFDFYERTLERLEALSDKPLHLICSATLIFTEAGMREDLAPLVTVTGLDALPESAMNDINDSSDRLMDYYLSAFAHAQEQHLVREFNSRAIIAAYASVFQWMPKWYELLTPKERKGTAAEIVDLIRIGIAPTDGTRQANN